MLLDSIIIFAIHKLPTSLLQLLPLSSLPVITHLYQPHLIYLSGSKGIIFTFKTRLPNWVVPVSFLCEDFVICFLPALQMERSFPEVSWKLAWNVPRLLYQTASFSSVAWDKGRGFLFRPVWLGFSSTLNGPTIPSSPNSKQEAVCEIFFAVIPSSLPYEVRCIWLVVIYLICFPHSRLFRTFTQRNEEAWGSLFHFRPDIQTHKIIFIIMLHKRNNTHDTTNERMHASESCVFSQLILSACFSSSLRARSVIMFLVWFSPDVTFVWLAGWLTCFAPRGMKIERILWKCCAPVNFKFFWQAIVTIFTTNLQMNFANHFQSLWKDR